MSTDQEGGEIRNLPWARPPRARPPRRRPSAPPPTPAAPARDLRARGDQRQPRPRRRRRDERRLGDARPRLPRRRPSRSPRSPPPPSAATAARTSRPPSSTSPASARRRENTDDAPVSLTRTPAQLLGEDLPPFRAAIAARVPLVMASHALYPSLDANAIASQSRYVLHRLLRQRLGFGGVVVTDSLEARAVTERAGPGRGGRALGPRRRRPRPHHRRRAATCRSCERSSPRRGARRRSAAAWRSRPRACSRSSATSGCERRTRAERETPARPRWLTPRAAPYPARVLPRLSCSCCSRSAPPLRPRSPSPCSWSATAPRRCATTPRSRPTR